MKTSKEDIIKIRAAILDHDPFTFENKYDEEPLVVVESSTYSLEDGSSVKLVCTYGEFLNG